LISHNTLLYGFNVAADKIKSKNKEQVASSKEQRAKRRNFNLPLLIAHLPLKPACIARSLYCLPGSGGQLGTAVESLIIIITTDLLSLYEI
jgi:hypothetical protein